MVSGTFVLVFIKPTLAFLWEFVLSNVKALGDASCTMAALGYTDRYGYMGLEAGSALGIAVVMACVVLAYSRGDQKGATGTSREHLSFKVARLVTSRWLATPLAVFVLVGNGYLLTVEFLDLQMNASFHQRLAVLAPKISDQNCKEFLASWASMRNEDDYRALVDRMTATAQANGVALPDLLPGASPAAH